MVIVATILDGEDISDEGYGERSSVLSTESSSKSLLGEDLAMSISQSEVPDMFTSWSWIEIDMQSSISEEEEYEEKYAEKNAPHRSERIDAVYEESQEGEIFI